MQLHAAIEHPALDLRAPPLGHRRVLGCQLAGVERQRATIDERPRDVRLGAQLGECEARVLERPDRLAEGVSLAHVVERPHERRLAGSHGRGRDRQALLREVADQVAEALALLAEQVLGRHARVRERQLGCVLRVLADLLELARTRKALRSALDDDQADAAVALGRIGLGGDDHQIGVDPVGDERLGPVEHVMAAVADRARAHTRQVRADARLGHRDRRDQLARGDPPEPALALLLGAVAQEVGEADVVLERHAETEAAHAGVLRLLSDDQVETEILHARAAMALGHGHSEEASTAREREHLAWHDARALPLAVAAIIAHHLALEEGAIALPEVFVHVLEQRASHRHGPYLAG